ncbi:MAG: c(7)-type cytochrome triheme domain-containing protein [Nitrospirota bacterium]
MSKYTFNSVILFLAFFLFPAVSSAVPDGVTLTWPGGGAGKVTFDGTKHAKIHCDACHIAGLFKTKKGADIMTMDAMKQGKFCGVCHNGKKAFSTTEPKDCHKCHKAEKKETSDDKKDDKRKDTKKKKHN